MSARVVLPCDDNEEWKEIQTFLLVLSQSSSPEDLRVFAGVVSKSLGEFQRLNRIKMLNYLHQYLKDYCTAKDRDRFFKVTLPCICRLASQLPSLTPSEGIPFGRSQEEVTMYISKNLVSSLMANCFLCTFAEETTGDTFPFTFGSFFGQESFNQAQISKCKGFLLYFEKIAEKRFNLDGFIKLQRKLFPQKGSLYSAETWKRQRTPLCSFRIEDSKKIEDCGTLTVQVDFANAYIGGGVLHSGCVQEEIRFAICPELVVSRLLMEKMDSNEAIVISGYERCANYKGYGWSLTCTGECHDDSQRDDLGAPMSSLVAIDALNLSDVDSQYATQAVLRELNKALTGFAHHSNQGDLHRDKIAHLAGKSIVVSPGQHQSEGAVNKKEPMSSGGEPVQKETPCKEINLVVPQTLPVTSTQLYTVAEVIGFDNLSEFSDSLAYEIIEDVKTATLPSTSSVAEMNRSGVNSETVSQPVKPEHTGGSGDLLTTRRAGSVQFMLDLKWSQSSNPSTRSIIGSDPDPSGLSTVSHYSSCSSSVTGQARFADEYSEMLSNSILSQAIRKVVSPDSSDSQHSDSHQKDEVSSYVGGLVNNLFITAVEEVTTPAQSSDNTSLDTKPSTTPSEPPQHQQVSEDFATSLSQKLVMEAVKTPSDHLGLKGGPLRVSMPHLLSSDRIKRAPSTDAIWSTAPTMDQDSSPPSPGELDAMAIDYASNITEYADLLAFKCMADAIRSLTGQELNESFDETTGRFSARETPSDEQNSLQTAHRLVDIHRVLLRPIVTGNWGCGAFGGNPQLKALIQWAAVSASGRPEIVYCTFRDRQLKQLKRVIEAIEKRGLNVGQLSLLIFRCCEKYTRSNHKGNEDFFSFVLKELSL